MCRLRRGGLQTAALAVCWIAPSFAAGEPNLPVSDMLGGVPHARASARARCHWGERGHDRGQGLQWPPGGSPAGGPGRRLALQPSVGCKRLSDSLTKFGWKRQRLTWADAAMRPHRRWRSEHLLTAGAYESRAQPRASSPVPRRRHPPPAAHRVDVKRHQRNQAHIKHAETRNFQSAHLSFAETRNFWRVEFVAQWQRNQRARARSQQCRSGWWR